MSNIPNDLVQCDIDTALALYLKGYTHIPILKRDGLSQDWSSLQPLYLDDLLDGVMFFASDSKRESLLNPQKTDIGHVKEEIYLEAEKTPKTDADDPTEGEMDDILCGAVYDEDDDPDWVGDEPETAEEIPDEDESESVSVVEARNHLLDGLKKMSNTMAEASKTITDGLKATADKVTEEGDSTVKDKILKTATQIELGESEPWPWNVRDAIYYHDRCGISYGKLATFYGIKSPQTVINRINNFKCK